MIEAEIKIVDSLKQKMAKEKQRLKKSVRADNMKGMKLDHLDEDLYD